MGCLVVLLVVGVMAGVVWYYYRRQDGGQVSPEERLERFYEKAQEAGCWLRQHALLLLTVLAIILTVHLGAVTRWWTLRHMAYPGDTSWFWGWLGRTLLWLLYIIAWVASAAGSIVIAVCRRRRRNPHDG